MGGQWLDTNTTNISNEHTSHRYDCFNTSSNNNDVQKKELERRIANSKKQKEYKDESATKKRRKNLRVGRLQQNVNYNKDYKNPKDVRKHKSKI